MALRGFVQKKEQLRSPKYWRSTVLHLNIAQKTKRTHYRRIKIALNVSEMKKKMFRNFLSNVLDGVTSFWAKKR